MAGDREVRIRFTGEGGVLKGTAAELRTLFGNLQNDTDDLRTAGEKWADAYRQQSARIKQEMDDVANAAFVLADSLGPDMVAALEAQGRSVEQQVQELHKMGLSYDDIKVDSEQLAQALKDRDDVLRQSTGQVGDGFKKVAAEADKSRSVVANFAGNAIQEIPGIAGAFGPLNMAVGQFTEYATEADITMKGFAAGALPIAAISAAMYGLQQHAKKVADAWRDVADAAEASSRATDRAVLDGLAQSLVEVTAAGEDAAEVFDRYAEANLEGTMRLRDLAVQQGLSQGLIDGLTAAIDKEIVARKQQTETTDKYGAAIDEATGATEDAIPPTEDYTAALEDQQRAADEAEQAQRDLTDAKLASIDTTFAVADAQDRYAQSLAELAVATDDPKTAVNEYDQSLRNAEQSALAVAQANLAQAEAQATAEGRTLSAAERNQILIDSLNWIAGTLAPDSPLRQAILGFIGTIDQMPPSKTTDVSVTGTEDASGRMGFIRQTAEDEAGTAQEAFEDLKFAVEDVPTGITIAVNLSGITSTMNDLERLRRKLGEVEQAAEDADRAVAKVAD